ncbi:cytochrome P450 family protein [Nonomuraea phyllanthi]|uniref:hypothetical protein n=1 Tax=Nonomuraea phyllanthi TaxID=2219224 RepID=UPI001D15899F|nr:hypothetical protein [Nonomuraea phyllanthi]
MCTHLRRPGRLARLAKSPSGVPSAVEEVLRSDVHRPPDPRPASGHHALSAGLARMQLQVMVRQLAERVPTLRPAGKPLHTDRGATRRLTSLPVTFHALRRTG